MGKIVVRRARVTVISKPQFILIFPGVYHQKQSIFFKFNVQKRKKISNGYNLTNFK